jgi:hypothetical protein
VETAMSAIALGMDEVFESRRSSSDQVTDSDSVHSHSTSVSEIEDVPDRRTCIFVPKHAATDGSLWYDTVRRNLEMAIPQQLARAREVFAREHNLSREWCEGLFSALRSSRIALLMSLSQGIQHVVRQLLEDSKLRDIEAVHDVEERMLVVDRAHERRDLLVETIASIYNVGERQSMMQLNREQRIVHEFTDLSNVAKERSNLHRGNNSDPAFEYVLMKYSCRWIVRIL